MKLKPLRFRQVHLDFHTSPEIPGIGTAFDKKAWQETLQAARVNSITCFSKCHHGVSYHPTKVGTMHPHLKFDLLRAQIDASREIDVKVPVYLSAGLDNTIAQVHPEWREINLFPGSASAGWSTTPIQAGWCKLCFNSPYLDYLCRQIEETVTLFPEADGILLDIIFQGSCCCKWCMEVMEKNNLDPEKEGDRRRAADLALDRYYRMTTTACKVRDAGMPVFHNSGHITRGRRDVLQFQTHLELESLPTGGWGYDHFPESASYVTQFDRDFLGMTGKFHTTWGEFGGFKHPNALRYEAASMLAFGAKCSIGDQLHPSGRLDPSTYRLIGAAYSEVEAKEPWCAAAKAVFDIAVLSSEAENNLRGNAADTGACRILLEGHHLFALIDREMDFSAFRLLILPDDIRIDDPLRKKIEDYLKNGGKLLLSGLSGLGREKPVFAFDIGADYSGESPFEPDYILPASGFRCSFVDTPLVMYGHSQRVKATTGKSLGQIYDPYFNRTYRHFCSHQHTPNRPEPSGYDAGVRLGNIAYLSHPVFTIYRNYGAVAYKEYILAVINNLLGDARTVMSHLPSAARITMRKQSAQKRQIVHLLYANKATRGGKIAIGGSPSSGYTLEVIEELDPLFNVTLKIRAEVPISRVTLEPQGLEIPHQKKNDRIEVQVNQVIGHQMIVLHESAS